MSRRTRSLAAACAVAGPAALARLMALSLVTALVLCGATTARAADTNPPLGEIPAAPEAAECLPVIVYVTRGSSENNDVPATQATGESKYYEGLGEEMEPVYVALRELYAPGQLELVSNRAPRTWTGLGAGVDPNGPSTGGFPSVGIAWSSKVDPFTLYERSVEAGVKAMVGALDVLHTRCPDSKLLLIGYSEGAEISRRALARLSWTPEAGRGFVFTFGDVLWRAAEPGVKYVGDAARDQKGAIRAAREGDNFLNSPVRFAIPPIPAWRSGWDVTTYCHGGDFACQWRGGTLVAHGTYHREDALGASARMAHALGGEFAKPVITAIPTQQGACYPVGARLTEQLQVEGPAPDGFTAAMASRWEPFSSWWQPFKAFRLAATDRPVRRTIYSGMARLVVSRDGHKLDYRNAC